MYPRDDAFVVKVNGVEIPMDNLPYQHPAGFLFQMFFKFNYHV